MASMIHLLLRYFLIISFIALFVRFSLAEDNNLLLEAMIEPDLDLGRIQQLLADGHDPNAKNDVGWVHHVRAFLKLQIYNISF